MTIPTYAPSIERPILPVKPSILIAHQRNDMCALVEIAVAADMNALTANTGNEALKLLRVYTPSLIILQDNLIDINGYTICSRLKRMKRFAQSIIVITTTTINAAIQDEANLAQANDVLIWPFQVRTVRALLPSQASRFEA